VCAFAVNTMLHALLDAFQVSYRLALAIDCSSLSTRRLTHFPFSFAFHRPPGRILHHLEPPITHYPSSCFHYPIHLADTWWLGSLAGHPVRTSWHLTMASWQPWNPTPNLCIYFHKIPISEPLTIHLQRTPTPIHYPSFGQPRFRNSGPLLLIAYSCIQSFIHMPESWAMSTLLVCLVIKMKVFRLLTAHFPLSWPPN